jgi:hypothetical protein
MSAGEIDKNTTPVTVSLTGGLGNQLFQFVFALHRADGSQVLMTRTLGNPSLLQDGNPELCAFDVSKFAQLNPPIRYNWFSKKCANLILRLNSKVIKNKSSLIPSSLLQLLAAQGLRISTHKSEKIIFTRGLGFDFGIAPRKSSEFCIGYFQSHVWATQFGKKNLERIIKLKNKSEWLTELEKYAHEEKPIVLHLRIGDYANEKHFGRPSNAYYETAVHKLWITGNYNKIWVFSDTPEQAKVELPDWIKEVARWIPKQESPAAETLEAMRYGHAYVISNSTFSWWGAFLSYMENPQVIAPTPWFKDIVEPSDLIPRSWMRFPSEQ